MKIVRFAILIPSLVFAQRTVPDWRIAVDQRVPRIAPKAASSTSISIRDGEFVRRIGSTLSLAGRPFRFNGNNTYYLQAEIAYRRNAGVEETLDKMAELGITVARANAHNDHPPSQDPAAIQTDPGVFNEANLVALDQSVAEAKKRNIRLILKLTNNWTAYGGIERYVQWKVGHTPSAAEKATFYTDATIKQWFKDYVKTILLRRNTVTGLLYKDETAIMAWELGNELRNPVSGGGNALVAWMTEMAAYIKSLDTNHLVADGGEGFDDDATLYAGIGNRYPVAGSEGCSYHRMVQIADIDMVSYHMYPSSWGLNDTTDSTLWIKRHEELARAAGKVAYLGEYGKRAADKSPAACSLEPGRAYDSDRAKVFGAWLEQSAVMQASAGVMAWQLINDSRTDCEGFQIYCPRDGATCDTLRQYSGFLNEPAVVTSGASFRGVFLAPDSFASIFAADLENRGVDVIDSRGVSSKATVFYAGPTQINFLVPAAVSQGGAVVLLSRNGASVKSAAMTIAPVEPGVFSSDASGSGTAAAVVTIVKPDGGRVTQLIDAGPVDLAIGEVVVTLYGTGWRLRTNAGDVRVSIGGVDAAVLFSGAQPEFPGLDQINVRVPTELRGRGQVAIAVNVSGRAANLVSMSVR